ncbi:hypothetical protein [Burkholderia cepacia]|uniref:hypothetical protein n=1 Tax=Burkholderia cepacia TaxID=292 RepID=UPI00075D8499|nr:hypothetical protein [Burkholderia cepacia]KVH58581.1 hypothetical protein WJ40_26985 [Burkholderia cepacia]KVQ49801.1 hypothetical protein WK03_07035 [Burkholderia cepacia]KVS63752.1 hypothetical protein WK41_28195 [Burkholderia cepacia]MDN7898883.1 hypothetical protein [Burkholderia cepacia]QOH35818.1 putative membrane protein [Burkholderia cepacia]
MSTRRESRLRAARIVGLLMATVVLTISTGWFVVYGLIVAVSATAADHPIAVVIRETPDYLVLAALLLAGLVRALVDLAGLVRGTRTPR